MDHKPYLIFVHVQNPVYSSTLPNVACKELVIPLVFVSLIKNVMEQNPVGFPNSMYPHVGPYIPYFGSSYQGHRGCSQNVASYVRPLN
jgi:hypothetical protein